MRAGDGERRWDLPAGTVADTNVHCNYRAHRGEHGPLVLGARAHLRSGTVLYEGSVVGERLSTGHNVIIREGSRIGHDVAIWSNSIIDYGCVIGDRVKVHSHCYVAQFSVIEDDAFLAPGVVFANDLFPGDARSAEAMRGPTVGRGAQVGVNVTVLPYVTIGARAIVGAGSVVTRDVPAGMIAFGCPAVPVREVGPEGGIADRVSEEMARVDRERTSRTREEAP